MTASATHRLLAATVALGCAVAGCQSQSEATHPSQSPASGATPSPAAAAGRIDACSMLSAQDISPILGVTVPGRAGDGKQSNRGSCTWENPANYESITLEIQTPGTAPHNTLPAPDPSVPKLSTPGPDGMRLLGLGTVEFAAGNRDNNLQVAVLKLSAEQANSAAISLARKVIPQVPA